MKTLGRLDETLERMILASPSPSQLYAVLEALSLDAKRTATVTPLVTLPMMEAGLAALQASGIAIPTEQQSVLVRSILCHALAA